MNVVQCNPLLCADKHKTAPELQKKLFNLLDKCFFKLAFHNRLAFGNAQKLKNIGVFDDVAGRSHFNPLLRKGKHRFLICFSVRKQQSFIKRGCHLTL